MELNPNASHALNSWLKTETWHTTHSLDSRRFYNFVNEYWKEHRENVDEEELREEIETRYEELKGKPMNAALQKIVKERVERAYIILDFLHHKQSF